MSPDLKKAIDIVYDHMKGFTIKAVAENDERYVFAIRCSNGSIPILGTIPAVVKKTLQWKPYTVYDKMPESKTICVLK